MKVGEIEVGRIGLGTNRLTRSPANVEFIRAAVDAGVRMIDSAHLYSHGESEETIGEALSPFPQHVVVASKGGFGGPGRGRPEVLRSELAESLRRLRTDSIYLYYLHRVDPETPIEESLGVIKEFQDGGKVKHVGISEVGIEQIERARKVLPIVAVQNAYNLTERRWEPVIDYCAAEGIIFVPFFPLRGDGGVKLSQVARVHRATRRQITLAWLLHRSPAMLPIPGTLNLEHLQENLAAEKIHLSDAEVEALR
jgi:pyridoxine 4-dehydrogenase